MNRIYTIALYVTFPSLNILGCVQHNTEEVRVVVTSDGNGNLQSEIPYVSKDVIHGLAKYYYIPTPFMVNYWYPGRTTGASVTATSRSVNLATWARWYLNPGY
jgi:hypothetical protein